MALRMIRPYRMPTVGERLIRDFDHCLGDRVGSLLFVLMRLVEVERKCKGMFML
jgi:hypothetical protein